MTWYKEGLHFKCTGCGRCCSKEPGYVWLSEEDIEKASTHLSLSREAFLRKYTRFVNGEYSLIEMPNYDCIFLKENKCTIYEARPAQCRRFPFWPSNLESKKEWQETAKGCEGINHPEAKLITLGQIKEWQKS